jgi:anti-sigma B factor antagonist
VDLELSERTHDGHVVVELRGDLDISTASDARERLLAILAGQAASALILDLSGLDFLDSTGVSVLVAIEQRAGVRGRKLFLAAPQKIVARVLRITSLDKHFRIYPTVEEAIFADCEPDPPVATT